MSLEPELRLVPATVHGRVLVSRPRVPSRRWLVGFHGYGHNAAIFLDMLRDVPGSDDWLVVSVQGLHPFYHPRTNEVLANWMTRQDREHAIADNIGYVDAVVADLATAFGEPERLVFAGFSQGVAMAFRAGVLGARRANAVFAAGGDVPPELEGRAGLAWPVVVLCAGRADTFYTPKRLEHDLALLASLGAEARGLSFEGGHEWSADVKTAAGELLSEIAKDAGA